MKYNTHKCFLSDTKNHTVFTKQVDRFLSMTDEQRELFMSMIPFWHLTVDELLDAVQLLID